MKERYEGPRGREIIRALAQLVMCHEQQLFRATGRPESRGSLEASIALSNAKAILGRLRRPDGQKGVSDGQLE